MMSNNDLTLDELLLQKTKQSKQIVNVNEKMLKLVIFSLADEWYAFYGENISEILPENTTIFFVPGCPQSLMGVINLRGEIESVIHLALILSLKNKSKTNDRGIILLGKGIAMSSGIFVDQVIDVVDVPETLIQDPPETLPDYLRPNVLNVLEHGGRAVTILNLQL